jgi:DNA-binding NtrC family response regulator
MNLVADLNTTNMIFKRKARKEKPENKLKVVVVDNKCSYGKLIEQGFETDVCVDVDLFENGDSLFKNICDKPDIVIIDFGLPDMDGANILKFIRRNHNSVFAIILSEKEGFSELFHESGSDPNVYILKDACASENLLDCISDFKSDSKMQREAS